MEKLVEEKNKNAVAGVTVVNFASRIRARAVNKLIQKSLERAAAGGRMDNGPMTARLPPEKKGMEQIGVVGSVQSEEEYRDPKRRSALF